MRPRAAPLSHTLIESVAKESALPNQQKWQFPTPPDHRQLSPVPKLIKIGKRDQMSVSFYEIGTSFLSMTSMTVAIDLLLIKAVIFVIHRMKVRPERSRLSILKCIVGWLNDKPGFTTHYLPLHN